MLSLSNVVCILDKIITIISEGFLSIIEMCIINLYFKHRISYFIFHISVMEGLNMCVKLMSGVAW